MLWEWQVWRCFDDARETLDARGWRLLRSIPLAAEYEGLFIVFLGLDAGANECLFELRSGNKPPAMILRGLEAVPTPEEATGLLARRAATLRTNTAPRDLPLYEPETVTAEAR